MLGAKTPEKWVLGRNKGYYMQEEQLKVSQAVKKAGLPSLKAVSLMSGVSTQTLRQWHESRPVLFGVVLDGCLVRFNKEGEK